MAYTLWKTIFGTTDRIDNLDNLDALISSRMSSTKSVLGSTAVANANITKIKGSSGNTDNLVLRVDATISSRAASSDYTQARAIKIDNLDAAISSRMSSTKSVLGSTAVANANLTKVKGSTSNTDNWVTRIDDEISSRMSSTKSVLGSTQIVRANVLQIKSSTVNTDNLLNNVTDLRKRIKNTVTVNSTKLTVFDDGSTSSIAWTQTLEDNSTTVTQGEATT